MLTPLQELTDRNIARLIGKSGVLEWLDDDRRQQIADAAIDLALMTLDGGGTEMAVTAVFRQQTGTVKTWKSSGGDAAITLASLANGSYREGAKLDFGATRGQLYAVFLHIELAATPTAGNTIDLWMSQSDSATAATDNQGGCGGTDAAYTGYSSNTAASVKQLTFVGSGVCTAQATATVQKMFVGYFSPVRRYCNPVLLNGSGAAVHSSDANCFLEFDPVEFTSEPS